MNQCYTTPIQLSRAKTWTDQKKTHVPVCMCSLGFTYGQFIIIIYNTYLFFIKSWKHNLHVIKTFINKAYIDENKWLIENKTIRTSMNGQQKNKKRVKITIHY